MSDANILQMHTIRLKKWPIKIIIIVHDQLQTYN